MDNNRDCKSIFFFLKYKEYLLKILRDCLKIKFKQPIYCYEVV